VFEAFVGGVAGAALFVESMSVGFSVAGRLAAGVVLAVGGAATSGGDATTVAGVLDAVGDTEGTEGASAAGLIAATAAADGHR
jgi:hypothetical protein